MKRLRVTLPDGRVLYEMWFDEGSKPICLGKIFVEQGLIVVRATGDDRGAGSIVTPTADWVGDMAFSVSDLDKKVNDEAIQNGDVVAGDGQHVEC